MERDSHRSSEVVPGWRSRPVAIPEDVDDPGLVKTSGRIRLPGHIAWSGQSVVYDLDDPSQRAYVYEQVLREGTDEDIRNFIDVDELVALWPRLFLPPWIKEAWAQWLHERRGLDLAC